MITEVGQVNIGNNEYLNLSQLLEAMSEIEKNKGIPYEVKQSSCMLCLKKVLGDLHLAWILVNEVYSEPGLLCWLCLRREFRSWLESLDYDEDLLNPSTGLSRKTIRKIFFEEVGARLKNTVAHRSVKGYRYNSNSGRFITILTNRAPSLADFEVASLVYIHPSVEKQLKRIQGKLENAGIKPSYIPLVLNLSRYFYSRYHFAVEHGLKLPRLEDDELAVYGAFYTSLYARPEYSLILAELLDLKDFYGFLHKILGFGVFPFERAFTRPSEVLRLGLWGMSRYSVYFNALYWADRILLHFYRSVGEGMKHIVLAAFYRELMLLYRMKKLKFKVYLQPFLEEIEFQNPIARTQLYRCFQELDWVKSLRPFLDEYRDFYGLNIRRDEVEGLILNN